MKTPQSTFLQNKEAFTPKPLLPASCWHDQPHNRLFSRAVGSVNPLVFCRFVLVLVALLGLAAVFAALILCHYDSLLLKK
jgi:hypothetical protein